MGRVTAAAIYTAPSDSRVYGSLDIDVTEAKRFMDAKRQSGVKITMVHLTIAVLARAVAFDVPELNCFIRRGSIVGRERSRKEQSCAQAQIDRRSPDDCTNLTCERFHPPPFYFSAELSSQDS